MILISLALASLVLLLLVSRTSDAARGKRLAAAWDATLEPHKQELLDHLVLAVREHRLGVDLCDRALRDRDRERLQRAVAVVEGFAPGVEDGLSVMRTVSRCVSTIVPVPPVRPSAWRAWELRGLSGLVLLGHAVMIAAVERLRLRIWLLGRALKWTLDWLRGRVARLGASAADWARVEGHVRDLATVGDEAQVTYESVVHSLDAIARLEPASAAAAPVIRNP